MLFQLIEMDGPTDAAKYILLLHFATCLIKIWLFEFKQILNILSHQLGTPKYILIWGQE